MSIEQPIKDMEAKLRAVLPKLLILAGNEVVNFAKDRFRFGNWRGNTIVPWKKRASKNKKDEGRAILIQSRRLARSIRVTQRTSELVAVGTDVPYARAHNEGFEGTVQVKGHNRKRIGQMKKYGTTRKKYKVKKYGTAFLKVQSHSRKMNIPQRQFLPTAASPSPWLNKKLQVLITNTIMKALK